jgi:hypothetical protein
MGPNQKEAECQPKNKSLLALSHGKLKKGDVEADEWEPIRLPEVRATAIQVMRNYGTGPGLSIPTMPTKVRGGPVLTIHQSCDREEGHIIGPSWVSHFSDRNSCIGHSLQLNFSSNIIMTWLFFDCGRRNKSWRSIPGNTEPLQTNWHYAAHTTFMNTFAAMAYLRTDIHCRKSWRNISSVSDISKLYHEYSMTTISE